MDVEGVADAKEEASGTTVHVVDGENTEAVNA